MKYYPHKKYLYSMLVCLTAIYLYNSHTQEVKVGYSSELFKQILWYKVPSCVLKVKKFIESSTYS